MLGGNRSTSSRASMSRLSLQLYWRSRSCITPLLPLQIGLSMLISLLLSSFPKYYQLCSWQVGIPYWNMRFAPRRNFRNFHIDSTSWLSCNAGRDRPCLPISPSSTNTKTVRISCNWPHSSPFCSQNKSLQDPWVDLEDCNSIPGSRRDSDCTRRLSRSGDTYWVRNSRTCLLLESCRIWDRVRTFASFCKWNIWSYLPRLACQCGIPGLRKLDKWWTWILSCSIYTETWSILRRQSLVLLGLSLPRIGRWWSCRYVHRSRIGRCSPSDSSANFWSKAPGSLDWGSGSSTSHWSMISRLSFARN